MGSLARERWSAYEQTSSATRATAATTLTARRLPGSSRGRFLVLAGVIALGLIFLFGGDSWLTVLNTTLVAALATLALNVLSGYTGQVSLGIAFFMGVGANVAAWLGGGPPIFPGDPSGLNLPFIIWLPAAGIVAALLGALIGPTALRLKGFYLGIVTLGLIFIGAYLFNNLRAITGGPQGRSMPVPGFGDFSISSPTPVLGLQLDSQQWWFLLLVVVMALAGVFVANIARSRAGRAWQAVRDNEAAASIMGVNLFTAKMGAFVLSSFLAGIAGALYASYIFAYTQTTTWGLVLSIGFIAAMLIGGVASVWGSILGAAFVFALPAELANLLPQSTSASGLSILTNNLNTDSLRGADYRFPALRAGGPDRPYPSLAAALPTAGGPTQRRCSDTDRIAIGFWYRFSVRTLRSPRSRGAPTRRSRANNTAGHNGVPSIRRGGTYDHMVARRKHAQTQQLCAS